MGRTSTIAMVLIIVLALIGAGLLAGALGARSELPAGPAGTSDFKVTSPDDQVGAPGGAAAAAPDRAAVRAVRLAGVWAGGGVLAFGSVLAQLSPTPTETPSPVESPSELGPTETPSPIIGGEGVGIPIDDGVAVIPLPEGWSQIVGGSNYTLNFDGVEGYLYAEVDSGIDPSTDAGSLLPQVFDGFIAGDSHYSQLQPGEVEVYQPFGGIVSRAAMWYQGEWGDTQASYGFGGKMWLGIRNDGKAFLMTLEIYPSEDWDLGIGNACTPVYQPSWESFAGEAFPYDPCAS